MSQNAFSHRVLPSADYTPAPNKNMPPEIQKLWQAQEQLRNLESDLDEVRSQRARTPPEDVRSLQAAERKIEQLEAQINAMKLKDADMTRRLMQTQATVSVQSQELANLHDRPVNFRNSPMRFPRQGYSQGPPYELSSPPNQHPLPSYSSPFGSRHDSSSYGPAQFVQTPRLVQSASYTTPWHDNSPQSSSQSQSRALVRQEHSFDSTSQHGRQTTTELGSPLPANNSRAPDTRNATTLGSSGFTTPSRGLRGGTSRQTSYTTPETDTSSSGVMVPAAPPQTPARTQSSTSNVSRPRSLVDYEGLYAPGTKETMMKDQFEALFNAVQTFAHTFANFPRTQNLANLPGNLRNNLLQAAGTNGAFPMLSNPNTRYFLVARMIYDWMCYKVFLPEAFSGLNEGFDRSVAVSRSKLISNTTIEGTRSVYLQDIASEYKKLQKVDQYGNFMANRSHTRAMELVEAIRPLKDQGKDPHDFNALLGVVRQAYRVAEKMFTDAAEYHFGFPNVNQNFRDVDMRNFDENFSHMHPQAAMARGCVVKLAITPQVIRRTIDTNGVCDTKTIVRSNVLLKY